MAEENKTENSVVAVVENEDRLLPLLSAGYRLARYRGNPMHILLAVDNDELPSWASLPPGFDPDFVEFHLINDVRITQAILAFLREHPPMLVIFSLPEHHESDNLIISDKLDPLLSHIKCPTALLRAPAGQSLETGQRSVMMPFVDSADSHYALDTTLALGTDARIKIVSVAPEPADEADRKAQDSLFEESIKKWSSDERVSWKLLRGDDPEHLLLEEAQHHDAVVVAASRGNAFIRAVLGDKAMTVWRSPVQRFIAELDKPLVLVRQYQGWFGVLMSRLFATGDKLLPTLSAGEQIEVYRQIRRAARPSQDFFLMIALSAGIAGLGLIMNSPAIIIGAMLIAPLMSAIIGIGLAIVQGDVRFIGLSVAATLRGAAMAIAVGFVLGVLDFDRDLTNEMLSRSAPTLLDLLVAMISGIAAGYALCRKDVSAALPGVAIAVALVPPLATIGLFLGMGEFTLAYGAFLLFLTNLVAIVFASGVLFALLGFRPPHIRDQDVKRIRMFVRSALGTAILVIVVTTHLAFLSIEEATETGIERTTQVVLEAFALEEGEMFIVDWGVDDNDRDNLVVAVDFASPEPLDRARISRLVNQLANALDTGVELTVLKTPAVKVSVTKTPED